MFLGSDYNQHDGHIFRQREGFHLVIPCLNSQSLVCCAHIYPYMHLCIFVKSFHCLSLSSLSLNQSPLKCPTNMSPCSFPNQYAVSIKRGNLWSELAILSCWSILHHCHTKTRVPILWQPACISPPKTSLGSFSARIHLYIYSDPLPWASHPV